MARNTVCPPQEESAVGRAAHPKPDESLTAMPFGIPSEADTGGRRKRRWPRLLGAGLRPDGLARLVHPTATWRWAPSLNMTRGLATRFSTRQITRRTGWRRLLRIWALRWIELPTTCSTICIWDASDSGIKHTFHAICLAHDMGLMRKHNPLAPVDGSSSGAVSNVVRVITDFLHRLLECPSP